MSAEILSWSRSKGLFAGISLSGATLRNDLDANEELYGSKVTNKDVLASNREAPAEAQKLNSELNRFSTRSREKEK